MNLTTPINIMLNCCIPDKKRLMREIGRLAPGGLLLVEIDDCVSSRAMVESFLKNKWCRIVKVEDREKTSILHIRLELQHEAGQGSATGDNLAV